MNSKSIKKIMLAGIACTMLTAHDAMSMSLRERVASWCTKKTALVIGAVGAIAVAGLYGWHLWSKHSYKKRLKGAVDALVNQYLGAVTSRYHAMPYRSDLDGHKEVLQKLIWQVVEQALNHFKDKDLLKTITSYCSGHLGVEYLVVRALELAGFCNIQTINLVDIMYTESLVDQEKQRYAGYRKDRADARWDYFDGRARAQRDGIDSLIEAFRNDQSINQRDLQHKGLVKSINAIQSIDMHTAAVVDISFLRNQQTDLLLLINYQQLKNVVFEMRVARYVDECRKRHCLLGGWFDFNDISALNTHEHALIVKQQGLGIPKFYTMPQTLGSIFKKAQSTPQT